MRYQVCGWVVWLVAAGMSGCGLSDKVKDKLHGDEEGPGPDASGMLELLPDYQLGVGTYESCAALEGDIRSRAARQVEIKRRQDQLVASASRSNAKVSAASAPSGDDVAEGGDDGADVGADEEMVDAAVDNVGNVQEGGVAEADEFSVSERYVFLLAPTGVRVIDRDTLEQIGSLPGPGGNATRLFATADRLVVIGSDAGDKTICAPEPSQPGQPSIQTCRLEYQEATTVAIYDAAGAGLPKLVKQHGYQGGYLDARLVANRLVIVGRRSLFTDEATPDVVLPQTDGAVAGVSCTSIAKSPADDLDFGLTVISTYDIADVEAAVQTTGMLGAGDRLYMTKDALYLAKSGMVWQSYFDERIAAFTDGGPLVDTWAQRQESLVITKATFDVTSGAVTLAAFGKVDGRVKDQWSFKQLKDGLLAVMTSTGVLWSNGEASRAQNHLWVLKQDGQVLTLVSGVKNFGTDEDIRAVRYVGDIGYVVTFRETDPLFAFDLSDPLAPKLLGELFMPGFSTYLHPVEGGRMIGIGENGGLQLSLYDVADPTNLRQMDVKILSGWGSSSEAQYDHHAFYYDAERLMFAIPYNDYTEHEVIADTFDDSSVETSMQKPAYRTGALVYRVDGEKLVEVTRISHQSLGAGGCAGDVRRIMQLDGRLITLSGHGIMEHDPDAPEKAGVGYKFKDADASSCGENGDSEGGWDDGDVIID